MRRPGDSESVLGIEDEDDVSVLDRPGDTEEPSEADAAYQRELKAREDEESMARLNALGDSLARTRAEAINGRNMSGIEDDWREDEEFYQGIDDANRGEMRSLWRTKEPGAAAQAPSTPGMPRSTVFPNITGPYVDMAAARISDMLLPTDDRGWSLNHSPIPDMAAMAKGEVPLQIVRETAAQFPGKPDLAKQQLTDAVKQAMQQIAEAKEKAGRAQTRIEDWHVECNYHAEVRRVIEDSARIGVGILKGPVPQKRRRLAIIEGKLIVKNEVKPGSRRINPWNFYPDPACGENIHDGAYTWEEDRLTKRRLRELKGMPGYIDSQIDKCLEEGAIKATGDYKPTPEVLEIERTKSARDRDSYQIWYFHGTVEREDLEAAGCDCTDVNDAHVPALITMVNNRVIKATLNPLVDTGDFPYDVMPWRRRAGFWAGQGIARQIRTPQRIVTAATRNIMDNAGLAAGPILVFRQGVVYPADGVAGIAPRKVYYIKEDADEMTDATKAIGVVKIDMIVNELMVILKLGLDLAEQVTGMPMLLQGQMGKAPDTLGGMQLLNNNASAGLRRLARMFDDCITEPHVRRYYAWLMEHGEDAEKGDFAIDARGSSALVERDLQNQAIAQMAQMVQNPLFGADPKKWFAEFCKSQHLDVKRFEFDDEQWKQIVDNMKRGPQDARLAVAQFMGKIQLQMKQMEQVFEAAENEKDRHLDLVLKDMDAKVEEAMQAGKADVSLTDVKAMLAGIVMKLRTQTQLSREAHVAKQITTPPTEPAGKAEKGKAYAA